MGKRRIEIDAEEKREKTRGLLEKDSLWLSLKGSLIKPNSQ
jgi:hypothetical protein